MRRHFKLSLITSQAHGVDYRGVGRQANWYLVTSENDAALAVAHYRQRMQIEQGFRDLKGYWGQDHLAEWLDQDRVACLLAWLTVYEGRLAHLWLAYSLSYRPGKPPRRREAELDPHRSEVVGPSTSLA